VAPDVAERILETFIRTPFEGGRHARRVAQLADLERAEAD
jgi:ribose 5-phosphate isomerase B